MLNVDMQNFIMLSDVMLLLEQYTQHFIVTITYTWAQ
jgi:hypothetical protein